jgi:hypothetical protein
MNNNEGDPSAQADPKTGSLYHPVCLWKLLEQDDDPEARDAFKRGYHFCIEQFDRDRIWARDRPRVDEIVDSQHLIIITPEVMEKLRNGDTVDFLPKQ